MKHQNHLLKRYGTVLSRTLLCSTLTCAPLLGVQTMMADTSQMAQTHVRGTVVDENGEPIIGANIMVVDGKNTQGTISDMDGNFQINAKAGTKIKVSYVGFETQTLTVKNGMRITMVEDSKTTLKGVEVVAYGVQKKGPFFVSFLNIHWTVYKTSPNTLLPGSLSDRKEIEPAVCLVVHHPLVEHDMRIKGVDGQRMVTRLQTFQRQFTNSLSSQHVEFPTLRAEGLFK